MDMSSHLTAGDYLTIHAMLLFGERSCCVAQVGLQLTESSCSGLPSTEIAGLITMQFSQVS